MKNKIYFLGNNIELFQKCIMNSVNQILSATPTTKLYSLLASNFERPITARSTISQLKLRKDSNVYNAPNIVYKLKDNKGICEKCGVVSSECIGFRYLYGYKFNEIGLGCDCFDKAMRKNNLDYLLRRKDTTHIFFLLRQLCLKFPLVEDIVFVIIDNWV